MSYFWQRTRLKKFRGNTDEKKASSFKDTDSKRIALTKRDIIYEDDDILLINKAAGELSQKASPKRCFHGRKGHWICTFYTKR